MLIFFQIIELTYPARVDYPTYTDASHAPHPRTEAKLLRDLVAHAGNAVYKQTQLYLQYLGLEPVMSNRSDPDWLRVVSQKVGQVQAEAYRVIDSVLNSR